MSTMKPNARAFVELHVTLPSLFRIGHALSLGKSRFLDAFRIPRILLGISNPRPPDGLQEGELHCITFPHFLESLVLPNIS